MGPQIPTPTELGRRVHTSHLPGAAEVPINQGTGATRRLGYSAAAIKGGKGNILSKGEYFHFGEGRIWSLGVYDNAHELDWSVGGRGIWAR